MPPNPAAPTFHLLSDVSPNSRVLDVPSEMLVIITLPGVARLPFWL